MWLQSETSCFSCLLIGCPLANRRFEQQVGCGCCVHHHQSPLSLAPHRAKSSKTCLSIKNHFTSDLHYSKIIHGCNSRCVTEQYSSGTFLKWYKSNWSWNDQVLLSPQWSWKPFSFLHTFFGKLSEVSCCMHYISLRMHTCIPPQTPVKTRKLNLKYLLHLEL